MARADLHGRVVDCSQAGFLQAMAVSCHSFIAMARLAEPLMNKGGALLTMSYYGADKVVNNYNVTRVSFNGGPKGTTARPTPAELQVQASRHIEPTPNQLQHEHTALATPTQRASVNHGVPQVAATPKPAAFTAPEVVHARSEPGAARTAGDARVPQPAPVAAQRAVPQLPRTEAHTSPQPAAARENLPSRGEPPVARVAHNMQPLPVREAPAAEKPAAAHTEAAPRAEPAPHAQPPQSRAEPQPRAERPEPSPRAESRGQEKPNGER